MTAMSDSGRFSSVDYEIHGSVQGVFFRQYTLDKAQSTGVVGWVMNTEAGTVKGTFQGTKFQVDEMKHFVSKVGSPMSQITRAVFTNERELVQKDYERFSVSGGDW
ncbi:acylphosphatase-2-like [Mytilus edulis]|uniref:Acylphosphatase n=2 Tax=Mytilus galloprovincialis TaxID=29158 RepID=A0A8B6DM29_MYTGA|nr:acylphosphatase [Mytilus galloprovincialis]